MDEARTARRPGWTQMHLDSIEGKARITWVNGSDDKDNDPPIPLINMTERAYIRRIAFGDGINIQFSFRDQVRRILGI